MTIPTVEEVVEEFDKKTNPENYYNDDIKHGQGIYELKDTDGLLNICYYPDSPYEIEKQKVIDWLRTTLTTYGNARYEEGVKEERERIVEYVQKAYCTQEHKDKHYCGFNDGEQVCDCYNEALDDLIAHLHFDK